MIKIDFGYMGFGYTVAVTALVLSLLVSACGAEICRNTDKTRVLYTGFALTIASSIAVIVNVVCAGFI